MLYLLSHLHKQQKLIEPDECRYICIEILSGKTQGMHEYGFGYHNS